MIEIERKYLVTSNDFKNYSVRQNEIAQGYISSHPERTVRVRIKGNQGFLTIKGKGNESGTTRFEWEKEITLFEAEQLLKLCEVGVIKKTRYEIPFGKHLIEVDIFHEDNEGLIIAEIELESENEIIEIPNWLGEEVTQEERYYNAYISQNSFKNWSSLL